MDVNNQVPIDDTIEVESNVKKEETKDLLINEESAIPEPMNEFVEQETTIRDIKGFVEVLGAAPTHTPQTFFDSIKIVGTHLYIYNYVTKAWVDFTGA